MPCSHSQTTKAGVLCPVRLSQISNRRNGGNCSGKVNFTVKPCRHPSQMARCSSSETDCIGGGKSATSSVRFCFNQGCKTLLAVDSTPKKSDLSISRMKQGHDLGGAIGQILMRLFERFALGLPIAGFVGMSSIRTGLIFSPNGQSQLFSELISPLNQVFFAWLSGSLTF